MPSHSITQLLAAVHRLSASTPEADKLPTSYPSHQDHWVRWLEEYNGPGYYGRQDWDRDARFVYQHLNNPEMIIWINEAAGEDRATIEEAVAVLRRAGKRRQTTAAAVRAVLPWSRTAELLFGR
jgi:hypothetical protein